MGGKKGDGQMEGRKEHCYEENYMYYINNFVILVHSITRNIVTASF